MSNTIRAYDGVFAALKQLNNVKTRLGASESQTSADPKTSSTNAGGNLGSDAKATSFENTFVSQVSTSLGSIGHAELTRASSRLKALQVQQQLAGQMLNIANGNPTSVLRIFR